MTSRETRKRKASILLRFSQLWLVGIGLLLGVDWLSESFRTSWQTRAYFVATIAMSIVAFAYFGIDKRRAKLDKHRISERQLHLMAFFGGWPGAVMGQQMFRHKTIKMSFRMVLWVIIACHVALSGWFIYRGFTKSPSQPAEQVTTIIDTRPPMSFFAPSCEFFGFTTSPRKILASGH